MPVPIAEQEANPDSVEVDDDTMSSTSLSPSSHHTRTSSSSSSTSSASSSSSTSSELFATWHGRLGRLQHDVQRAFSAEPPGSVMLWRCGERTATRRALRCPLLTVRALLSSRASVCCAVLCRDSQRKRELYRDCELARMDFCDDAQVDAYLTAHSHAASDARRAELEKTELGAAVHRILHEFDALRDHFNLKGTGKRHSKVEMWTRMVLTVGYTLLSVVASLYLMPLRLLHPLLRRAGLKNHFLPIDLVQKHYSRGFLFLCGVDVRWEGLDGLDYEQPVVGMFSHASNMDPMILASGPFAFKWIAKHSLFRIPFFGWTLAGWGHYSIDRSDVESAKRSLAHAAQSIHRYRRCLAVSPEGTRSKTGRLMDFKKGPFHTAIAVDLPIVPVLIMGAYQLWPPNQLFPVGGPVVVRMLPPIRRRQGEGYKELSSRVRRAMLRGIAEPSKNARVYTNSALYLAWLPVALTLCALTIRLALSTFGL